MDDYWKLEVVDGDRASIREDLKKGGYHKISKNATYDTLQEEWFRMQQGRLHYEACTTAELKRFIADRRLRSPATLTVEHYKKQRGMGRRQNIDFLKQADDEQTFDKFLDLPNELQSHVAELSMDFENPLPTPCPPPLTQTSRHLRELVLPIFYGTQSFHFAYLEKRLTDPATGRYKRTFRLGTDEKLWLGSLSTQSVACIRTLVMSSLSFDNLCIKLEKSKVGFKVDMSAAWSGYGDKQGRALERELSKVLEKVEWVDKMRVFKMGDLHAIRRALEAALRGS